MCRPGTASRIDGDDLGVVVAREGRVDPALQAHLGGAALPRLLRAAHDLVHRHEEGRAAQVLGELALRERAEAALEVTDVRVLDVPRHDVGDLVAAHLAPQPIGSSEHPLPLAAAGREQPHDLVPAELLADELERDRIATDEERHLDGLAGRPAILAGEAERVRGTAHGGRDGRVDPAVEVGDVLGIERQPRGERELRATRSRRAAARSRATAPRD